MSPVKFSIILSFASWTSFFMLAWPMLMRRVELDGVAWGFLISFVILAVLSAAATSAPKAGG